MLFTASHRYLDDSGAGASTVYAVSATVTDKDLAVGSATTTVTVDNVAPTLVLNAVTAIIENGVATLTGIITDPGTQDTFTLSINWGDPLSPNDVETYTFAASATGTQSFTLTHRYLDDNVTGTASDTYTISASLQDKDLAVGSATTTVTVNNVDGYVCARLVFFLINLHLSDRSIWLTRHGESEYNVKELIGGDPDLSERGRQFAESLERLSLVKKVAVLSAQSKFDAILVQFLAGASLPIPRPGRTQD